MTAEKLYDLSKKAVDKRGFSKGAEITMWLLSRYPDLKKDFQKVAVDKFNTCMHQVKSLEGLLNNIDNIQNGLENTNS